MILTAAPPGATVRRRAVAVVGAASTSDGALIELWDCNLVSWADSAHLGRLAFWSVDRDQACGGSASGLPSCSEISQNPLDFTRIFDGYSG